MSTKEPTGSFLILTIKLNLLSKESIQPALDLIIEIQKMNYSFQKSIVNKINITKI